MTLQGVQDSHRHSSQGHGGMQATPPRQGTKCLRLSTKYNVEYIDMLRKPFRKAFDLQVENLNFWGRNASHMEMTVCARWVRTDIAPTSGAAVLEVDIPTGYHTQKQLLRRHQWTGPIYSLRSRFTKQKVVLYFEYLNNTRSCWYFTAERWYPVANMTIQNRVRVYSTYEPALHNTTIYTTMNLFHLHICQVCGSFQCPYCPFYNPAARPHSPASTALACLLSLLTLCYTYADQFGHSEL
ncbi:hypothetical protein LSAT2_013430 [Lamellibrachia satsuma]|nr:hypothetical protein LSAT2_013430 [Lamellibrachia satsuma]